MDPVQTTWNTGQILQDLAAFTTQAATHNTQVAPYIVVASIALDGQSTIIGSYATTEFSNGNLPQNIISDIGAWATGTAVTAGVVAIAIGSAAIVPISVAVIAGAVGVGV